MSKLPHVVVDAKVYVENTPLEGQASVQLPNLQAMTETIAGAGIMGELDMPIIAQYQSMQVKFDFATPGEGPIALAAPATRLITVRAAVQHHDVSTGGAGVDRVTCAMRAHPKATDIGKLEKASGSDTSVEMEVLALRYFVNDVLRVHIDKTAYICVIDGVDYGAVIRRALGLE